MCALPIWLVSFVIHITLTNTFLFPQFDMTTECIEGSLKPIINDCSSYSHCSNGIQLKYKCPEESYFNPQYKVCIVDERNICLSTVDRCLDGESDLNPENYCGYLKCVNGTLKEMNCDSGKYYNITLKECLSDDNRICSEKCVENQIESDAHNYCGYLKCINGTRMEMKCPQGSYFNGTHNICLTDNIGICHEDCAGGEIVPNVNNQCGYLRCQFGSYIELNCKNGTYFNATLMRCLNDETEVCSNVCEEGELEVIFGNSCGYWKCVNRNRIEVKCDNGKYFNETLRSCRTDDKGMCATKCIDGQLEQNPINYCGYVECMNGQRIEGLCANGSYFNASLKTCSIDENHICNTRKLCKDGELLEIPESLCSYQSCSKGKFDRVDCGIGRYFNVSQNACVLDERGLCQRQNCQENDLIEDPDNFCGYLKCIDGQFQQEKCIAGSAFNVILKICQIDDSGICDGDSCTDGDVEFNPKNQCGYLQCKYGKFTEINCTHGHHFDKNENSCQPSKNGVCSPSCIEGKLEVDPDNCAGYLQCISGEWVRVLCTDGNYFDAILKCCLRDRNGICRPLEDNCIEGSHEADQSNCAGYKECIEGDFIAKQCPIDYYFDKQLKSCVKDENGACIKH